MSASRAGRPRAAWRSTNRAASTAAEASAAVPTSYARTRPPWTTTDRSRPSTSNSSTNVASPTSSTRRSTSRAARARAWSPLLAPTSRRRCWMAFSSRARSRSSTARRLVVVPRLGQPPVVGAQRGQQTGQLPVVAAVGQRAGPARGPPPLAPPQLRSGAGRRPRGAAPAGPARRPAPRPAPAARCCPAWPGGRRGRPARAGRRATPRVRRRAGPRSERLGQPGGGPHQPGRMAPVARGGRPQLRRVVAARVGGGPAGEQPRERGVLRPCGLERRRQLARPSAASRRPWLPSGAGPRARPARPGRPRTSRPWRRKLVARGPRRGQGGVGVAAGELGQRPGSSCELGPVDRVGPVALASSSAAAAQASSGRPGGEQRLAPVLAQLDGRPHPSRA